MTDEQQKKLNELIDLALEQCDKVDYPHVCNMASHPDNRPGLVNMIMAQIKESGISVNAAMNRIEGAYNPNRMED